MRPMSARRVLSEKMILEKTRVATLNDVRNLNLWGERIEDISVITQLRHVEVVALVSNRIQLLRPFAACSQLKELYLRKNCVASLAELNALRGLSHLHTLWLMDNPCALQPHYRAFAIFCCPHLQQLDDVPVTEDEREAASGLMTPAFIEDLLSKQPPTTPPVSANNKLVVPVRVSPSPKSSPRVAPTGLAQPKTPVGPSQPGGGGDRPNGGPSAKGGEKRVVVEKGRPSNSSEPGALAASPPVVVRTRAGAVSGSPPVAKDAAAQDPLQTQDAVLAAIRSLLPLLSASALEKLQKDVTEQRDVRRGGSPQVR